MKQLLSLIIIIAAVVTFVATPAQHPVVAQDGGEITIWMTGGENDATALQDAAIAFTEETGIVVNVEAVSWGDAYSRYLTAVNSGQGADLFTGGMSWGISLGDLGGLVDLSTVYADELEGVLGVQNPEFVNAIVGVDGAVYGVPYNQDVHLMYYMIDNLAQVGFDAPPATWEEFEAAVTALNDAGLGGGGFGWGHGIWLGFQPFLAQAGGSWYEADCSAAAINSEAGLTALEFFTILYDDLDFPAEQVDTGASFATGELSVTIDGEWTAAGINPSYPDLEGQWAVAPLPTGPGGNNAAFIGGKMIGVFSYSENVDEAWQFIQWLQTSEAAEGLTQQSFNFGQLFIPTVVENAQFIQGDDAVAGAIATQLEATTAPPNCPGWEESNAEINLQIQGVLFEGNAFEDALIAMEDILNDALVEYGG